MNAKSCPSSILLLATIGVIVWTTVAQKTDAPPKRKLAVSIQPQHIADALRAVILSDREVYLEAAAQIASQKDRSALVNASADTAGQVLAPCELLRRGSQVAASKGVEFSYTLRSMLPLNKRNYPETALERKGLELIASRRSVSFAEEELLGGRWYFTAVYPDIATHQACADCHNHAEGLRKKLNVGDPIGALVVRIALEL